ncbi:hypothetical protein ACTQ56_08200 [[Clostridium] aminophilum]|uniref:hypothetical protein n=1 Tax=[Clostridium] aminophilum TaxID=1526 RepID=UPI003F97906D
MIKEHGAAEAFAFAAPSVMKDSILQRHPYPAERHGSRRHRQRDSPAECVTGGRQSVMMKGIPKAKKENPERPDRKTGGGEGIRGRIT